MSKRKDGRIILIGIFYLQIAEILLGHFFLYVETTRNHLAHPDEINK